MARVGLKRRRTLPERAQLGWRGGAGDAGGLEEVPAAAASGAKRRPRFGLVSLLSFGHRGGVFYELAFASFLKLRPDAVALQTACFQQHEFRR